MKRLLVLVSLLTVAACTQYTGNPAGLKVGVTGDSITAGSVNQIRAELEPQHLVAIEATPFERADQTAGDPPGTYLGDIDQMVTAGPQVVVINFGSNDLKYRFNAATTLGRLADDRAKFPHACVISVTLSTHATASFVTDPTPEWFNGQATLVNAGLPTEHLIDWNAETTAHPEYLQADGIHPTNAGRVRYAQLIRAAVQGCPVPVTG